MSTKATIIISEGAYKAILAEQFKQRMEGKKLTIAELASHFLELGVASVSPKPEPEDNKKP
jgi:hypothetical protein